MAHRRNTHEQLGLLGLYWCHYREADDEDGCFVVAASGPRARTIFHRDSDFRESCYYQSDVSAVLVKRAVVPLDVTPGIFYGCSDTDWICAACDPCEFCAVCRMPRAGEKAREYGEGERH